ncbi:MAG: TIGR03790 family protein [Methylophilaceae bacterium]
MFCANLTAFNAYASGLKPENIAVVVNELDPKSVEIGDYYLNARKIPEGNLVKVSVPLGVRKLTPEAFNVLRQQIMSSLTPNIQALVLVWTTPYSVSCNSITSAMTLGYDAAQCEKSCTPGQPSKYFDSNSKAPYDDFGMRISMLLPIESVDQAKALIDRGVLSAFRVNEASAYMLNTSDKNRSTRAPFFPKSGRVESKKLEVKSLNANSIEDKHDVMFYFTGLTHVPNLATLTFMPGAIADHLTSFGGDLLGTGQMSSLRWLEAGATASYGTVSEPCNYWQKFPNPVVVMKHYLSGETAIEAYWKSVKWPAQGLFIGEPLATPY